MKYRISKFIAAFLILPLTVFTQTGGDFSITKSVIGGGTQNSSGGDFTVRSTVGQSVAGNDASGGDFTLESGFWTAPVAGVGKEGDVAPRPGGDGSIFSNDVVQVRRYFNDTAAPDTDLGEFQRADSAPRTTSGDGVIASNDIVQTRRYQNGTDAEQNAAGPLFEGGNPLFEGGNRSLGGSELRVESTSAIAGQNFVLNIRVDATGQEAEYGFRLLYQPLKLANPTVGAGNAGASVRACNTAVAGVVNCSVGGFPTNLPGSADPGIGEIPAGNNQILLTITFSVLTNAAAGASPLTLANVNTSNDNADLLTIAATGGAVNIANPSAANVSISGRVLTADGNGVSNAQVTMTAPNGTVRTARTATFGYYRFEDVPVGETYIFAVHSRRFQFTPRVVSVEDELTDLNFIAEP